MDAAKIRNLPIMHAPSPKITKEKLLMETMKSKKVAGKAGRKILLKIWLKLSCSPPSWLWGKAIVITLLQIFWQGQDPVNRCPAGGRGVE